jgi:hypothetical protein
MIQSAQSSKLRRLKYVLFGLLSVVVIMHVLSVLASQGMTNSWARWFDVDTERNFPTFYNGLLWFIAAVMIFILSMRNQKMTARIRWIFLALSFTYFGVDELLVLHEGFAKPIRELLSISDGSVFYHAWIIPALLVVGFILLIAWEIRGRDAVSREQKVIFTLLITVALGVILLEAVGTQIYFNALVYKLGPVLLEETFEMGMVSLILYRSYSYVLLKPRNKPS